MTRTLEQRSAEDFDLLVLAHSKGNPAMYALLRDRTLDADREKARQTEAERIALPGEIDTAIRD